MGIWSYQVPNSASLLLDVHLQIISRHPPHQGFKKPLTLLSCIEAIPRLNSAGQLWEWSDFLLGCPSGDKAFFASKLVSQTLAYCALGAWTSLNSATDSWTLVYWHWSLYRQCPEIPKVFFHIIGSLWSLDRQVLSFFFDLCFLYNLKLVSLFLFWSW